MKQWWENESLILDIQNIGLFLDITRNESIIDYLNKCVILENTTLGLCLDKSQSKLLKHILTKNDCYL